MNYIFDIDGTLWDTTAVVAKAWNDAIVDVGLSDTLGRFVTADMLKKEFGKPMDVIIDDLFTGQEQETKDRIMVSVKRHEQECVAGCTDDLSYPGVVPALRMLAANNKLYIVSNCQDGYIPLVTDKLGITGLITDHECFGASGLLKADNIRAVIDRNGIQDDDVCYIGDTLGDYRSAKEAGIRFIYAAYGFGDEVPYYGYEGLIIHDLTELIGLEI